MNKSILYYGKYMKYKQKNNKMNHVKDVPFIIIPKNTLLFRVVNAPITDFIGVKLEENNISAFEKSKNNVNVGKYCIPKEFNVFFYMSPFIADGLSEWFKDFKNLEIYATNNDIKILSMIGNSKYNRSMRFTSDLATSCDKVNDSCINGRYYDLCFSHNMIREHPSIMGWISVTRNDAKKFMNEIKNGNLKDREIINYIHLVKDNRGVLGPAEVAIYPLKKRINDNQYINESDIDNWINNNEQFNYRHIVSLNRDKNIILDFMRQHAILNDRTKFYEYKI